MSGTQVLSSFFTNQVEQAQQNLNRINVKLQSETNNFDREQLEIELAMAKVDFEIAMKSKLLFDTGKLTDRTLKDSLKTLRDTNNG